MSVRARVQLLGNLGSRSFLTIVSQKEREPIRSSANELASRLIARESSTAPDASAAVIAANVLAAVSADLCRFVGSDGCYALLTRARSQAQSAHPALKNITIIAGLDLALQGVPESIQEHGAAKIAAGLESTLVAVVELLGRLIGDELAMKLLENSSDEAAQ
jgi:hypothetical protein